MKASQKVHVPLPLCIMRSSLLLLATVLVIFFSGVSAQGGQGGCQDWSGWLDSLGDGCEWYEGKDSEGCPNYGNLWDGGQGTANVACCWCGGGTTTTPSTDISTGGPPTGVSPSPAGGFPTGGPPTGVSPSPDPGGFPSGSGSVGTCSKLKVEACEGTKMEQHATGIFVPYDGPCEASPAGFSRYKKKNGDPVYIFYKPASAKWYISHTGGFRSNCQTNLFFIDAVIFDAAEEPYKETGDEDGEARCNNGLDNDTNKQSFRWEPISIECVGEIENGVGGGAGGNPEVGNDDWAFTVTTSSESCWEGGCKMPTCAYDCQCSGGNCEMPICTNDCQCDGGGCDMSACTSNCDCKGGLCVMEQCTSSCNCSGGDCLLLEKKQNIALFLPVLLVIPIVALAYFGWKKYKGNQHAANSPDSAAAAVKPTFPVQQQDAPEHGPSTFEPIVPIIPVPMPPAVAVAEPAPPPVAPVEAEVYCPPPSAPPPPTAPIEAEVYVPSDKSSYP